MHIDLTDDLTLRGVWTFEHLDGDTVVSSRTQENLIVTTGKNLALDRLFGLGSAVAIAGMAVGTSGTAAAPGDTAITGAVFKGFDSTPVRTGQTVTAQTTYGTSEANIAIREVGLLTAAGGVLFNRIVTSAITKDSALSLRITVQITQA
jgi:hypothetical protein